MRRSRGLARPRLSSPRPSTAAIPGWRPRMHLNAGVERGWRGSHWFCGGWEWLVGPPSATVRPLVLQKSLRQRVETAPSNARRFDQGNCAAGGTQFTHRIAATVNLAHEAPSRPRQYLQSPGQLLPRTYELQTCAYNHFPTSESPAFPSGPGPTYRNAN